MPGVLIELQIKDPFVFVVVAIAKALWSLIRFQRKEKMFEED
jgi:hypothetical protein